jgi:hypothetical protein
MSTSTDNDYRQSLQTKFVCNFNKIIFYQVLSGALFSFFKNDLIEECYQKRSHVNEYKIKKVIYKCMEKLHKYVNYFFYSFTEIFIQC